jgi:hypothetical protein
MSSTKIKLNCPCCGNATLDEVGVPKPGATGVAEVKVIPWGK